MIDQVKRWLEEQGFPLEMQSASEFRKAGFEVTQANLYSDIETGKSRHIDVFAAFKDYIGVTRIAFVVECKASKKPWLLLSDPEVLTGYHRAHSFAVADKNAFKAMTEDPVFSALMEHCPWFRKDQLTGYSLRNAFSEKDIAFEATTSVAKASLAFVKGAKEYQQRVAFPVIVISSPLVRCFLDDTGQIQAKEIRHGEVFFRLDLENPWSCIKVVTLPARCPSLSTKHTRWQKFCALSCSILKQNFGKLSSPNRIRSARGSRTAR